jgi:peptidoglycan/xylan/chitin deacetylase (PgdA/CDA1 family)
VSKKEQGSMAGHSLSSTVRRAARRIVPSRYVAWSGCLKARQVALTFDDGPHPQYSAEILDVLSDAGVPATFFVVGSEVEKYPGLTAELAKAGHELGNHTFSHANLSQLGWKHGLEELRATDRLLREFEPRYRGIFRPPWGELGLAGAAYALMHRRRAVLWSVDSYDHRLDGTQPIVERVAAAPLTGGDILLFHDDNGFTAKALPAVISGLRERGFSFATASELLGDSG